MFCDSHLHIAECEDFVPAHFCCSCAHSKEEFFIQEEIALKSGGKVLCAFGLHPQKTLLENIDFLESLLVQKRILAVGETGFDFFTPELKSCEVQQKKAFEMCLELATEHKVPLVIHDRKALDLMFFYSSALKKCTSVVFHSFAFTARDAVSILNHGINAYFSFGKPLMNGNKKSIGCVKELPLERILLETDAPYQTSKGEEKTSPLQIQQVYEKTCEIRGMNMEELENCVLKNFFNAFGIAGNIF